jgi:hypothetical protein
VKNASGDKELKKNKQDEVSPYGKQCLGNTLLGSTDFLRVAGRTRILYAAKDYRDDGD